MKITLKGHMKRTHGEKKFVCDLCDSKYSMMRMLNAHKKGMHGEKNLECDFCDSKFTTKSRLKFHINRTHGEKKFVCDLCGSKFTTKYYLNDHMNSAHMENLACNLCDSQFAYRNSLNKHMKTVHDDDGHYLCLCGKVVKSRILYYEHFQKCINPINPKIYTCSNSSVHHCLCLFRTITGVKEHEKKFPHPEAAAVYRAHPSHAKCIIPTEEQLQAEKLHFERTGIRTIGMYELKKIVEGNDVEFTKYNCESMKSFVQCLTKIQDIEQDIINYVTYRGLFGRSNIDNLLMYKAGYTFPTIVKHLYDSKYFKEVFEPIPLGFSKIHKYHLFKIGQSEYFPW